ncbi:MAG TPA: YbaK/EbsC family protein [Candidatus Limnocylindrales bacterium]
MDFEIHEHLETFTAASTARSEGVDARTFAKVVGVATDDGRKALIVVDAPDRVDLRKARAVLGAAEVRLLTETELEELAPGCDAGALPAVGELFGVPMYVDYRVEDDAEISFNAGTHRHSVRVDRAGWEQAAHVHYADLAGAADDRPAWAQS